MSEKDARGDSDEGLNDIGEGVGPLRRRAKSRGPRPKRVRSQQTSAASSIANALLRLCKNEENLDAECVVSGVTHRGGVRLKVLKLEIVTDTMIAEWRAECLSRGYFPRVSFDVTSSEALIDCRQMFPRDSSVAALCRAVHPLTTAFLVLVLLNCVRHALV